MLSVSLNKTFLPSFLPSFLQVIRVTDQQARSFGILELHGPFLEHQNDQVAKHAEQEDHLRNKLAENVQWLLEISKNKYLKMIIIKNKICFNIKA